MRYVLGIIMLALLSGCASSRFIEAPLETVPAAAAKEEIVVWHTYSDEETRIFENEVVPAFERAHPTIKVEPVRQPYSSELRSTLVSRATSGKVPDLVRVDISWVPELSQLGILHPLGSLPGFQSVIRPLDSVSLQTNAYRDEYYGLPVDINTKIAIYNRQKLQASGWLTPPTSLDDALAAAAASRLPVGIDGLTTWSLTPYFYALGGDMLDATYQHALGYINGAASVKAVHRLVDLMDQGVINQDQLFGKGDRWTGVLDGRFLMIDDGPWFYSVLANSKENTYDLLKTTIAAPFPGRSIVGGENMVILKGTKHLAASWEFMKWMEGVEAQKLLFKAGVIPTNKEVPIPEEIKANPFIMATIEGLKKPYLRPSIAKLEKLEILFENEMLKIFSKKTTVEQGLNEAALAMEQFLQE